jgi:hypothetical protein
VTRFVLSKSYGDPKIGPDTVKQLAAKSGSPNLVADQQGQAPFIQEKTASQAHTPLGAFTVTSDPVSPVVTVAVPWDSSTTRGRNYSWILLDVQLVREGDRWSVLDADVTPHIPEGLSSLSGAEYHDGDVDRYGDALVAAGFRRYANGDC